MWAPANSSREEGDVGSSPSPAKIPFSDEFFLNNSRVHASQRWKKPLNLYKMGLVKVNTLVCNAISMFEFTALNLSQVQ